MPCLGLFELDEFVAAAQRWGIKCQASTTAPPREAIAPA